MENFRVMWSLVVLGTRALGGMCESTRAGADVLHPLLVCESSARLVLGTVPALGDICCPNRLKLGKREAKQRHSSLLRAQSGSDGRDKTG